MPYPQNVQTAREVEQIIRDAGAVPATIAIIGGKICIGLSDEQLELLGTSPDAIKVSRRDLAYVLAQRRARRHHRGRHHDLRALAGIEVFVTGGIGGVHRGAETSFDISADLQELAQTSVAVVCAGVKSILDIGLTLEYLETHGVPVLSVGQAGLPGLLHARQRLQGRLPARHARSEQAPSSAPSGQLGLPAAWWSAIRCRKQSAMPKEEIDAHHRAGAARSGAQRRHGQGGDALPAGAHQGADRGAQPGDQHRAGQAQRRWSARAWPSPCTTLPA